MSHKSPVRSLSDPTKEELRRKFLTQAELALIADIEAGNGIALPVFSRASKPRDIVNIIDKLCHWLWTEGGY